MGQGSWAPSRGLTDARGYRDGGQVFCLDGSPDAALHLRRLPSPLRVRVAEELAAHGIEERATAIPPEAARMAGASRDLRDG